jgi:protein TonB
MAWYRPSRETVIAGVASIGLHALWFVQNAEAARLRNTEPTVVSLEVNEVPPVKPDEPVREPETKPLDNAKPETVVKSTIKATAPVATLPAAAQAGKTLTAPDDTSSNLADFTMVQGNGNEYVGGTTSSLGTNTSAVRGAASTQPTAKSIVGSQPTVATPGPDRSQSPRPTGADWNCSSLFPQDPDAGDYAVVSIVVTVTTSGTPKAVTVLRDPGHGFGAAARACAMRQRYQVGLDRQGQPTVATTPPITVRFTR